MSDDHHTALHEAGHVVMAYRLNAPVWWATIDDADHAGGQADQSARLAGYSYDENQAHGVETQVAILLAGYAACIAADFGEKRAMIGCGNDFNRSRWALIRAYGDDSIETRKARVVAIMKQGRNRHAVATLADRLIQRRRLEFEEIDACIEAADLRCRSWPIMSTP
jgi:hypothetical protein